MKGVRLFFAVWPPAGVRNRLWRALAPLRESTAGVRWVPPERLHVTLRFMGDTPPDDLPRLVAAADALRSVAPFEAELVGGGTFPRRGPPRVYWVGARAPALPALREGLDRALAGNGIERERRTFSPHLTVGRTKGRRPAGDHLPTERAFGGFLPDGLEFTVATVHLVRSDLFPGGPRYAKLHEIVLGRRKRRDLAWAGHSRDS